MRQHRNTTGIGDPLHHLRLRQFQGHEEEWLDAASEEETADLMVPMLTLSGLFDDEDFQKVRNSDKLSRQMADAIPDSLTDLYLLFHAPD